tara:strand:+ start:50 stop:316 length:267 start_codon:yes stop_codon:yes gene_type:complete
MGISAQKKKAPREEVEDKIHDICIVNWDTEFRVLWQSDDGGNHVVVAFEGEVPEDAKDELCSPFLGWRLIRMLVPEGYLAVFHPLGKK